MKLTVETRIHAPLADVWTAYTTPEDIEQWNTASEDWHTTKSTVDLRVGGKFSSRMEAKDGSFGFDFAGTYTQIVPEKLIEFAFGDRAAAVEFVPEADRVMVRVTFDAETANPEEQQRQGWQAILNNFAKHVRRNTRPQNSWSSAYEERRRQSPFRHSAGTPAALVRSARVRPELCTLAAALAGCCYSRPA